MNFDVFEMRIGMNVYDHRNILAATRRATKIQAWIFSPFSKLFLNKN